MKFKKIKIYAECEKVIHYRIIGIQKAIKEAQDSANNETKSSAGDKHETGRAMAQLETEKLMTQLSEALRLKETLSKIIAKETTGNVVVGSVVFTTNGNFYLSVSLGKIEIDGEQFFAISPQAPIGKLLLTKKEKESFSFNGVLYVINQIV